MSRSLSADKLRPAATAVIGALLSGGFLGLAQVQMDSEWPWLILSLAWVPLLATLPNHGLFCWALASLAHLMMAIPLLAGVTAAVGLHLGLPVIAIVSLVCALPFALHPWVRRHWGTMQADVSVLALMVILDAIRARSLLNWVGLGDVLGESVGGIAPLLYAVGIEGCLLILCGVNALWLWWGRSIRHPQHAVCGMLAAGLSVWPLLWPAAAWAADDGKNSDTSLKVALVAPGIAADEIDGDPMKMERLMAAYRRLQPAEVDIAIMPQYALNGLSPSEPALRQELFAAVARQGIPLLAGSEQRLPGHRWERPHQHNAAFLVDPQAARAQLANPERDIGAVQWQAKRRLVPWTEYWPQELKKLPLAGLENRLALYVPGESSQAMVLRKGGPEGVRMGVMLCYDAYASEIAAQLHRQGSQILIVLSSDESFSDSALSRQGLRMARLRGMSEGLPVVRIAWGKAGSGAFDAHGRALPVQSLGTPVDGVTLWHVPIRWQRYSA